MIINMIIPFKRLSGGIRVAFLYANYLSVNGHDVVCYMPMISYPGKGQSMAFRLKASISNTFKPEHWFDREFTLKAVPAIKERFVRKADITIATSWQTAYDVAKLPKSRGKKVYFVQDYETFNGEDACVDQSYQLGLNIVTITKQLAAFLNQRFHVDAKVIYNGIDSKEFIKGRKKAHKLPVLMMMYHESEHKGSKQGLRVVEQLREEYPDIQLNLFGRRKGEGIPAFANFLENPKRDSLMQMYRRSDIYLCTSKIEAWGLPVLEAMANKCAVVGFRVGALSEIGDGMNAVVVDDFNFEQLRSEVENLFNDIPHLEQIQSNGYNTACRFQWKKSYILFEKYLENLAKQR